MVSYFDVSNGLVMRFFFVNTLSLALSNLSVAHSQRCSQDAHSALTPAPCRHYVMTWEHCGYGSCLCTKYAYRVNHQPHAIIALLGAALFPRLSDEWTSFCLK